MHGSILDRRASPNLEVAAPSPSQLRPVAEFAVKAAVCVDTRQILAES
jgi:hypothetical protein